MERPMDVEGYGMTHRPSRPERAFLLKVALAKGDTLIFRNRLLMEVVRQALTWRGKAMWAEIRSYDEQLMVSRKMVSRLCAADAKCYGVPSEQNPFWVIGPTINPTFMERYTSRTLWAAVNFAVGWLAWGESPYWAIIRAPNGEIVLPHLVVEKMFHLEFKSQGGIITESIIHADGTSLLGKVISHRVIV